MVSQAEDQASKPTAQGNGDPADPLETPRWIYHARLHGPFLLMVIGGTIALGKGLILSFDLVQATFGAVLIFVAAALDFFIWSSKQRIVERQTRRAQLLALRAEAAKAVTDGREA